MKIFFTVMMVCVMKCANLDAQSPEQGPDLDEQLENRAEKSDAEIEDDSERQRLNEWHKSPLDLNKATEEDLLSIGLLTGLQVKTFLEYRRLLGKLISIHELQAIPAWDLKTIKSITPYIIVDNSELVEEVFKKRWRSGNRYILLRIGQLMEKSNGFNKKPDSLGSYYLGSPQHIFFRYTYNYKNIFQYGILGDKDPGEQLFKGYQRYGFDFYSFHFFLRKVGMIRSLALGDFSVNMGQGLIQWQSLAFSKSSDILLIKRQSPVLKPYHSAGEFNFHRGIGITIYKSRWELTIFVSTKKIGANLATDTVDRQDAISSFNNSGFHRTKNENLDRNNIRQTAAGANINFSGQNWRIGLNTVRYHFSDPVLKQDQPYNLFSIRGKSWCNYSVDYSYTYRNIHFFGEAAVDKYLNLGVINGALVSLSSTVDAALLYRSIDRRYQSLYSDAFTENTTPSNERGLYFGLSMRPFPEWRLDTYFDVYYFPWLKFRVDAPSRGRDYDVKLIYQPNKRWSLSTYFRNEAKEANDSGLDLPTHQLILNRKQSWRTEINIGINSRVRFRGRVENIWYNKNGIGNENGFLGFADITFKPTGKPFNANLSIQYFETDGYNSRIYVSEHDLMYSFSLPAFYDKGFRYYIKLNTRINRLLHLPKNTKAQFDIWMRWAQTVYSGKAPESGGLDQINDNKRSEFKFQLILKW